MAQDMSFERCVNVRPSLERNLREGSTCRVFPPPSASALAGLSRPRRLGLPHGASESRTRGGFLRRCGPASERHGHHQESRIKIGRHARQNHAKCLRQIPKDHTEEDGRDQEGTHLFIFDHSESETQRQEDENHDDIEWDLDVCGRLGNMLEYRIDQDRIESPWPTIAPIAWEI